VRRFAPAQAFVITIDLKKWLEHRVQATFGAFRLLLGGSTGVQLPLAKYEIYLAFSKPIGV